MKLGIVVPALAAVAIGTGPGSLTETAAEPQTVSVALREYSIAMPKKLRPGPTTFVLHNTGRFPHDFGTIYGPTRFHSNTVLPGSTARLTTSLRPGAYVVACTILAGGHLAQGMLTLFTIGSRAHGSAHWHYP